MVEFHYSVRNYIVSVPQTSDRSTQNARKLLKVTAQMMVLEESGGLAALQRCEEAAREHLDLARPAPAAVLGQARGVVAGRLGERDGRAASTSMR